MTHALARLTSALADRYRIERELGQGGMATVYLAQDVKHQRKVAVKVLRPELAVALGHERFLREITTTANLRHPHILPLYDSGEAADSLFYVMPYVEGESLRDRLNRETQLPLDDALRIAREVADALHYAHGRGVIHRDIKPENILLERGHAVVADFGIARAVTAAGGVTLTQTGLAIGTPLYMSPEQASGVEVVDARSDLYSLACVLYEVLVGQPPFTGPSPAAVMARHALDPVPPLRTTRPGLPAHVANAVERALAKAPADRFASAHEFTDALSAQAAASTPDTEAKSVIVAAAPRHRRLGLVIAFVIVAAVGVYLAVRFGFLHLPDSWAGATPGAIRSIAVLPFDNYSGDSTQEYFVEGMTDELTADLATISQLRVTSRGSAMQFKGKNRPSTPDIARALNVDAVVEGSVSRSGDKVRITAQLIDAREDKHLWANSFERSSHDVLALQAEVASAIAREINVRLTPSEQSRLAAAPIVNPEAHDAYLKGRYFFNRPSDENLQKAIAQFEEAVRLSPGFAPAYSGLSDAYLWAGYNEGFLTASQAKPKARATAERAVQLDSNSAEAHTSLAVFKLFYEYDWDGCEREFRRAFALNPNYAYAHDQFGMALAFTGRLDEAIAEGQRAAALDPLSAQILIDATMPFIFRRDFAAARELARKAAELDPTFFFPVMLDGWVDLEARKFRDAIPKLEKAKTMDAPPFVTAYLAYAAGASGDQARAMAELEDLKRMSKDGQVLPFNLALVYLGLGDRERALDNLERAYASDSQMLAWLRGDSMYDPLRSEPRFVALMKQLNFAM